MSEEEKKDFVVRDKRIFAEENQDTEQVEDKEKSPKEKLVKDEAKEKLSETSDSTKTCGSEAHLPKVTFPTFIFSLNSSAFVQLGLIEDPATGKKIKNLPLAKQTIDILGMLEEKTCGNLTKEEEAMLKNILYDLRVLYIKEKK
ncbi:DUF1844 domain-containing protein [Desulfonema magnum]|uniref:DUF1844 n=1 Tax=Desulfonema magnum TaxID=45655 RepID=A0A975GS82_9BACT|nr:DUF1844 domain-containing protein [Desulfonema magnum]QTA91785.1 DUF1844 [Desulfonema magnum]